MSDTSDDKGKDSQAEQTSKPEPPQSTDNSKKSTDSETKPCSQKKARYYLSEALEEKQKGNEAYKKKDFTTAHLHYDKAIELDPTEISFRNNKAAVYFEQKDYDKCIEVSAKAITIGREHRAYSTLIAKALARAGKAYLKKEDDDNALQYLYKSVSEHRTTETHKLCYEVYKRMKEKERHAYLDHEKNLKAKPLRHEDIKKVYQYTMTPQQRFNVKCFFEEATPEERSIHLVEIMNAMGFSKNEREIHRHYLHPKSLLFNLFYILDEVTYTIAGSTAEGLLGGYFSKCESADHDALIRCRNTKLYTSRADNINNPPLLPLHDIEDYGKSFFVVEDANFPGYVKLSKMGRNRYCTNTNDDNYYLPNSEGEDILNWFKSSKNAITKSNTFDACPKRDIKGPVYTINYETSKYTVPIILSKPSKASISNALDEGIYAFQKKEINGPAHTWKLKNSSGITCIIDMVYCIPYDRWPDSAKSFKTRHTPNKWPSNNLLENIQSQGCDVVAVGHHDSPYNDKQWRISFPGEISLFLDLNDVQIWCYALIKIILKENLNTSQREVVSSFHIKHVLFWCVQDCSCQWVSSNIINCLNTCLVKLIDMIKDRHIPHYIIESRNLFNSKMTEQMSKEICDVLSKYNTTHVFTLDALSCPALLRYEDNRLLKHETLISTIIAGFGSCFTLFSFFAVRLSLFWYPYIPHNATKSLLLYKNILQHLNTEKGAAIHYAKYVVSSMVGFLYYAKYKESNKTKFLLTSKRLIKKSLHLDNSYIKLRAATFFLVHLRYSQSIEICDTFLTFPPRYKTDGNPSGYNDDIMRKVRERLFIGKTTEEIENIMKAILPMFYSSVKVKALAGNYDIAQKNLVWIFRNLTNIYFHGLYMDVIFMTAEKWVVPDPILYELLSLQHADWTGSELDGIVLDPMFVCLQTKFLCYHSMGNTNDMGGILNLMNSFITENTFTTQSSCVYLNMLAYCQIKAGQHRQSVKSILQSLRIDPSRYNTASGYLNIVLQILNSLSIRLII